MKQAVTAPQGLRPHPVTMLKPTQTGPHNRYLGAVMLYSGTPPTVAEAQPVTQVMQRSTKTLANVPGGQQKVDDSKGSLLNLIFGAKEETNGGVPTKAPKFSVNTSQKPDRKDMQAKPLNIPRVGVYKGAPKQDFQVFKGSV